MMAQKGSQMTFTALNTLLVLHKVPDNGKSCTVWSNLKSCKWTQVGKTIQIISFKWMEDMSEAEILFEHFLES